MKNRVVITGLGVVAPNGVGISEFTEAIKSGKSGIQFFQELQDLNFSCSIGGIPAVSEELKAKYLSPLQQFGNFIWLYCRNGCLERCRIYY